MAHLYRLILRSLLPLLLLFTQGVYAAATCPLYRVTGPLGDTGWKLTPGEACSAASGTLPKAGAVVSDTYTFFAESDGKCGGSRTYVMDDGYSKTTYASATIFKGSGSGAQCEPPPNKCTGLAALCSGMSGAQKSYAMYDGDATTFCHTPPDDLFWDQPKYPGCNQGCMAKAGPSTGVTDSTGKILYKGMGTLTGGLCTNGTPTQPSAPDAPPPAKKSDPVDKRCAGQTGTVNGETVCVPASSATGVDWTGTTKNSDGTSTEGKTTTTCSNGVCESTTTKTTKDASGNVTGTTTSTDKVSQDQYCAKAKNKDGMLCAAVNANPVPGKDSQSGTGSGTGSGNGNGDGCTIKDCGSDSGGGPGKAGLPGTGAGQFGKLYEPKYPQGPVEVWKQSSAGIKNSGLGSLAMALMPKIGDGGSAPVWIVDFNFWPFGDMGTHDISPPLWLWGVIQAITLLTALIVARRLIFGG
ncbi:MAG: hypothetical protein LBV05_13290 [Comamonas sp.]|uniref:hypothetical protein n=1 Tax=Comamonas sp. TaxID=34028 RepID=UPI002846FA8E|nr:hypothetical protein [Comamonas sp.]MDR3066460.1 hypothetical protein [Comamonas sp.]